MNKAENDAKQDEEFVFNIRPNEIKNTKKLKGVEYRLGDQGYDIYGKKNRQIIYASSIC